MTGKRKNLSDLLSGDPFQVPQPSAEPEQPEPQGEPISQPRPTAAYAPVELFAPDPRNHRKHLFGLDDLGDRMAKLGQLQPVVAVSASLYRKRYPEFAAQIEPMKAEFVVIMGARRLGAAQGNAGIDALMYLINDALLDADDYREAALDENWRREDLTCLDDARLLKEFLEIDGTQQKVAERVGKSQPFVAQRLKLLELVPEAQDAIDMRAIGFDKARSLTKLSPEAQRTAVARLVGGEDGSGIITPVIIPVQRPINRAATAKWVRRYRAADDARALGTVLAEEFEATSFAELVQAGAEAIADPADLEFVLGALQQVRAKRLPTTLGS